MITKLIDNVKVVFDEPEVCFYRALSSDPLIYFSPVEGAEKQKIFR